MTATTVNPPVAKERSFADRGPVGRAYRRYLVRASLTMFALIIVSAYLLPLLYMVTTALQQPGQRATPGAPVYPAVPQTGIYQGVEYPVYSVPIDGTTRQLHAHRQGPRVEHVRRSERRRGDADRVAGPLADARPGLEVRAADRQLHDRLVRSSTSRGCSATRSRSPP